MKLIQFFFPHYRDTILHLLFLSLVTCVTSVPSFAQSQSYPYKIKYLTVDEGLSHTDANDIAQDKQGFIWIGTNFGLDRYDGYKIRKYYNSNEPLNNAYDNRVWRIYPDGYGSIWLGTEGGLQRFDTRSEQYTDYKTPNKAIINFEKLFKPPGNRIYGLVGNLIKQYAIIGDSIKELVFNLPPNVNFTDMVDGQDGKVYLSSNKGLWTLDQTGKFERLFIEGLQDDNISGVFFNHDKNLLIITANKLLLASSKNKSYDHNDWFRLVKEYVCANHTSVQNALQDSRLNCWINDGSHILKLDQDLKLIQTIDTKHGLNSNSLAKIFIDRSECLWVCTYGGGVNYFDLNEKPFYMLQHNPETTNSLSGSYVRSIVTYGKHLDRYLN